MFIWTSGWHSIWGIGAALCAIWTVVYSYMCYRENISPLKGRVFENKVYNFILTEGVFSYLYAFTWVQLLIIIFPTLF